MVFLSQSSICSNTYIIVQNIKILYCKWPAPRTIRVCKNFLVTLGSVSELIRVLVWPGRKCFSSPNISSGASINYIDKQGGGIVTKMSVIVDWYAYLFSKLVKKGGQNSVNVVYGCPLISEVEMLVAYILLASSYLCSLSKTTEGFTQSPSSETLSMYQVFK